MDLPVLPPVKPMLARAVAEIPPGLVYEPKWDGFRALVFRDGDDVEITSRTTKSMTRYFPELVAALRAALPARCVLDGEIIVAGEDGLDFEALQQRVHPAASRVARLAAQTPVSFVAFDLLAVGDRALLDEPFARRRAQLAELLRSGDGVGARVHLTPATDDLELARRWFDQFEGAGLDGIIAKPPTGGYEPDRRAMFKIKHERTADCVVAGYRPHKTGADAVGSLLLGLYPDPDPDSEDANVGIAGIAGHAAGDPAGSTAGGAAVDGEGLAAVGVTSAFAMARRRELVSELAALVIPLEEHPWAPAGAGGTRTPWDAGESRWAAGRDLSFVPLRPVLVAEVRYDHMEGPRFRHTTQFVRFRPDRDPHSCTFAQLERPVRVDLTDVLG
ncbi:ATP-dependent DNA ligase [Frankia sp. AiPs1]|uniref:ATP-dependent DNA ligase n=1 Tax=Frankia sp. AiPs1 TaxID=573493 RepID=UPI002043849F|nr:ATP-dependent DNA ligase [Frankia sp. AiPs1]MCM3924424.1 ATP-dependent DNA ligase [Frankia sp. AiPs1]